MPGGVIHVDAAKGHAADSEMIGDNIRPTGTMDSLRGQAVDCQVCEVCGGEGVLNDAELPEVIGRCAVIYEVAGG